MPQRNPSSKLAQRQAKGKGSANSRNQGRGTGFDSPPFLFTEEVGTPKASLNWGIIVVALIINNNNNDPSATPIKLFSLLKAGKRKQKAN